MATRAKRDTSPQYSVPPQPNQIERGRQPIAQKPKQSAPKISTIQTAPTPAVNIPSLSLSSPVPYSNLFVQTQNPENDPEFALHNLGIDLDSNQPLLPDVNYIASDYSMLKQSSYPVPHSFPSSPEPFDASSRIEKFSDELLFFIFYLHAGDPLQIQAFNELKRRNYSYNQSQQAWFTSSGTVFDTVTWSFVQPDENKRVPIPI